jgi:linoleoyl-CoA desaturase
MAHYSTLKFSNTRPDFFSTLNKRVNEYFKSNGITRHANSEMIVKTIFMFSLYFIPYGFIVSGSFVSPWLLIALYMVMGLGKAGIGLSIMHDANHGSYSTKGWVNDLIGYSLNLIGGNAFNWKVQHNVLHHTYTNVHEADEDISPRGVLRMSPQSEWKPLHRFQHIYAWVLYGLLTFVWITVKDYGRILRYNKEGLVEKMKANIYKELAILFLSKMVYFAYILVIPIVFLPFAWWQVCIAFFMMHYVSGFILAVIFQPAHVIDGTDYPEPDENGRLENSWAVHQLRTTTNFAQRSKIFSWYVGGLNLQVEHHLFPNVCHVHYRKISKIVKATAEEFNLPYKTYDTFAQALAGHAKLLKELGQRPLQMS